MLLTPGGATGSVACEHCGGQRLYRDQPSPVHGEMEERNMVDPGIGLDQGGNPNQEGIWGSTDGGWQNFMKRDESYASVRTAMNDAGLFDFESAPRVPSRHVIIDKLGGVYSGPYPESHERIASNANVDESQVGGLSKGAIYPEGDSEWYTHASGHSPQAMEQMLYGHFGIPISVSPTLAAKTEAQRWGIEPGAFGNGRREMDILQGTPNLRSNGMPLDRNEGLVRGGSNTEALASHFPFYAEAVMEEPVAVVPQYSQEVLPGSHPNAQKMVDGSNLGIHAGTTKWLGFLDAHVNGQPVRGNEQNIISKYGGRGDPVIVSTHHPDHLPAAVDVIEHSATGSLPSPEMIRVGRAIQRGEMEPPPGIGPQNFVPRTARAIYLSFGIGDLAGLAGGAAAVALAPETGGASLALDGAIEGGAAGGLLGKAAPYLMQGALRGVGSQAVQGLMGGGGDDAAGQNPSTPPEARDADRMGRVAEIVSPRSNPGFHDSPDGDTHQFADQSTDPNMNNPNLNGDGGSTVGEDNVVGGFGPNSPSMSNFEMMLPAVLHHYHSPESGAHDPMIQQLHQMMDKEQPGYLSNIDDAQGADAVQRLIDHLRNPGGVHASTKESMLPSMGQGVMMMAPGQNPAMPAAPVQNGQITPHPENTGNCPYCGGTTNADGSCPQCGAQAVPQGPAQPGTPPAMVGPGQGMQTTTPFVGRTAADTQGPVSKEQQAAVAQLLIDTNRHNEIPIMLTHPEQYAKELAEVSQNDQTQPPPVDPSQQPPPPPAVDPSQMAQMPMPGMSVPPPTGGSAFQGKVATPQAAAPRCPNCGSATTGFAHSTKGEVSGDCHSCGNLWDLPDVMKTAAPYENPVGVEDANQLGPINPADNQDSSHTWVDTDGDPLTAGQQYELFTSQYPIPDRVRIDKVKPDEIRYTTIGTFSADPNDPSAALEHESRMSREDFELQKYTFQKADQTGQEPSAIGTGPQHGDANTEPVPQPNIQPQGSVTMPDDHCPKCASEHITSSMSSATSTYHECYKCSHNWETKEEAYEAEGAQRRAWLMTSTGGEQDDFWAGYDRARKMGESTDTGSRSLASAAARDPRLREVSERLDANKMSREAGKKFTPYEQRQLIDERGTARNADIMDLEGTHYQSHRYLGEKANGANVDEAELFLGI